MCLKSLLIIFFNSFNPMKTIVHKTNNSLKLFRLFLSRNKVKSSHFHSRTTSIFNKFFPINRLKAKQDKNCQIYLLKIVMTEKEFLLSGIFVGSINEFPFSSTTHRQREKKLFLFVSMLFFNLFHLTFSDYIFSYSYVSENYFFWVEFEGEALHQLLC